MSTYPSDIAFTPAVKAIQARNGSRASYAKMERGRGWQTRVTPELAAFIAELDMFYLGTANAQGQPYIQYRGGPQGFLHVLDEGTLAFADFEGNAQYITQGNLSENPRAFLFLMDYVHRHRVKVWGRARAVEDDPALIQSLTHPDYTATSRRAIVFTVEAWDGNCPQHIHRRIPAAEVEPYLKQLQARIAELETQVKSLSSKPLT